MLQGSSSCVGTHPPLHERQTFTSMAAAAAAAATTTTTTTSGFNTDNNTTVQSLQSQGSSGPTKGTGAAFYMSAVERKLELLEARFSQPLRQQQSLPNHSPSALSTGAASETTLQPSSTHSPPYPHTEGASPATTTSSRASSATQRRAGGEMAPQQQQPNQSQQQRRRQSFAFDFPSPATSTFLLENKMQANSSNSSYRNNDRPTTVHLQTRSKRASIAKKLTQLDHVREAADRHMQKVAAAAAVTTTTNTSQSSFLPAASSSSPTHEQHPRQRVVVASSSCSEVSTESSTTTRLVQNRSSGHDKNNSNSKNNSDHKLPTMAKHDEGNGEVVMPAQLATPVRPVSVVEQHVRKRKSVPTKVEDPSVKENVPNGEQGINNNNKRGGQQPNTCLRTKVQRTLTATNNTNNDNQVSGAERTTSAGRPDVAAPNTSSSNTSTVSNNKKVQRTLAIMVKEEAAQAEQMNPVKKGLTQKSLGGLSPKPTTAVTPRRNSKPSISPRRSPTTTSRDAASKRPLTRSQQQQQQRSLPNRLTLHDFFSSTTAQGNAASYKRRKITNKTNNDKTGPSSTDGDAALPTSATILLSPKTRSRGQVAEPNGAPTAVVDPSIQKRIQELEQTCRDQEEQLKAVANNRTILHTALQAALDQREKELSDVKDQKAAWEGRSRTVLEEFVRTEATRTARLVRERLAADGARLGRLVYSRAGIRSAAVENWEEGHAICNLAQRKSAWKEKRKRLEERYRSAQRIASRWLSSTSSLSLSGEDADTSDRSNTTTQADLEQSLNIRSKMDALEAVESVRYHLENLRKEERDLMLEEQSLNDEKGVHIRALKRVASEDASRFRTGLKMHDRYVLKCLLGKGGFSEVWRAYDLVDLREVAVKIHQLDPRWSESKKENYTKHVSREYEIHRNVRHQRIVSLFDVFEIDNNSFATVLEFCQGTDLDALLKEKRRLPEREAKSILLQILSGMQYLSQPSEDGSRQGIIHYDLKPGNILFDEHGDAKITDFGLSKIVDAPDPSESMELTSQGAGTYWYLPPECFVMDETVRISNKVDVWSIGVIFYQMLFGKRPFGEGQSQDAIVNNRTMLNARQVPFPDRPQVSDDCKSFLRKCLSYDQAFRPTVAQLCELPYVTTTTKKVS